MEPVTIGTATFGDKRVVQWRITKLPSLFGALTRMNFRYKVTTPEHLSISGFAKDLAAASSKTLKIVEKITGVSES